MGRVFGYNTSDIVDRLFSNYRMDNVPGYGDSIDLRYELHHILHGGQHLKPKGHYVILRHIYFDKPTSDFDLVNKEAIGETPFEVKDQLVLSYRARPWFSPYNEQMMPPGIVTLDTYVYYFEYDVEISVGDFIYEYGLVAGQPADMSLLKKTPQERYNIKLVDPRRSDDGRIEYYRVLSTIDTGHRV